MKMEQGKEMLLPLERCDPVTEEGVRSDAGGFMGLMAGTDFSSLD